MICPDDYSSILGGPALPSMILLSHSPGSLLHGYAYSGTLIGFYFSALSFSVGAFFFHSVHFWGDLVPTNVLHLNLYPEL